MIDRRRFIGIAAASLLGTAGAAGSQSIRTYQIGVLAAGGTQPLNIAYFIEGLRELGYGPDLPAIYGRAAAYVDRIFKGTPPGGLPIELPTRHELAINLNTAKALGLTIPQSLLLRADEVIQ